MIRSLLDRVAAWADGRGGDGPRAAAALTLLPGPISGRPARTLRALRGGRTRVKGFPGVELVDGEVPWSTLAELPRTHRRQLHGHAVLRDLAHHHRRRTDRDPEQVASTPGADAGSAVATDPAEELDLGVALVEGWVAANPFDEPADDMAWHDETTAVRTKSWLVLREELRAADHPATARLDALLAEHAALLADPEFHAGGTNHGMFQDEALLTWACLTPDHPRAAGWLRLAERRLLEYHEQIVTRDGVHREHAPAYHHLVAAKTRQYARFFDAAGRRRVARRFAALHRRMAQYALHVVQPDGSLPLVSDTFAGATPRPGLYDDPAYRWVVTRGEEGSPPTRTAVVFPEGGCAVFRDRWSTDGSGTYMHLAAAYHTAYHKHGDDLSLWLYHDGELLTEAGPNGYDYADPYTAFAYSSHAHNTLVVDGESLPRVDGRTDAVALVEFDLDPAVPRVRGRNARWDGIVHERELRYDRGSSTVTVHDELRGDEPHEYTLLWHCAVGVVPRLDDDRRVTLLRDDVPVASLLLEADAPLTLRLTHGDIDANRGFHLGGGDPEPSWTLDVTTDPRRVAAVTTRVVLRAAPAG